MAGEIVHFELLVKDADRAQAFWSGLFGWSFQPSPTPEMDYRMAQVDEKSGAAIFQAEKPKEHPNVYLATDDIDASIAKVRELGGEAENKGPVPGFGWFSACKDTEGIEFHLWQGDSAAA
jgi:predicted enzyme related to lactoylglutathione lyase